MNFKILIGTWAFSMPSNEFQKCVDSIFLFTWKTSLSPKSNFASKCEIQPLIFVNENKDHIHNQYVKSNSKNIIKNDLSNGSTLIKVGSIFHMCNILTSLPKKLK